MQITDNNVMNQQQDRGLQPSASEAVILNPSQSIFTHSRQNDLNVQLNQQIRGVNYNLQQTLDSGKEEYLRQKQNQFLRNEELKTSMTTDIKNIMRRQDKAMITTSQRLLNSQVHQQMMNIQGVSERESSQDGASFRSAANLDGSNNTTNLYKKSKSTVSLLKRYNQKGGSTSGQQVPTTLPTLQVKTPGILKPLAATVQSEDADNMNMQSKILASQSSKPKLERPSTSLLLTVGDKEVRKQVKKKMDIKGARDRDLKSAVSHSYKALPQQSAKTRIDKPKDSALFAVPKKQNLPDLVSYQKALKEEQSSVSPFMAEGPPLENNVIVEPKYGILTSAKKNDLEKEMELMSRMETLEKKFTNDVQKLKNLNVENKYNDNHTQMQKDQKLANTKGTSAFFRHRITSAVPNQGIIETQFKQTIISMGSRANSPLKDHSSSPMKNFNKYQSKSKKFLPVEAFDPLIDIEDPVKLIQDLKDPATGQTMALSKWNFSNGDAELRQCQVLEYQKQIDQYLIRWVSNNQTKKVCRFNLFFEREDHDAFQRRVKEAQYYRKYAETIMKYDFMIDSQTFDENPELQDATKTRISYLINSHSSFKDLLSRRVRVALEMIKKTPNQTYEIKFWDKHNYFRQCQPNEIVDKIHKDMLDRQLSIDLLGKLFKNLDAQFVRTHKQIKFDIQLPYSKEYFQQFHKILPKEKFVPISERIIDENDFKGQIDIEERDFNFVELLQVMNKKLHQANVTKLKALDRVSINLLAYEPMRFIIFKLKDPIMLEDFLQMNQNQIGNISLKIQNGLFDSEYDVGQIIASKANDIQKINEERIAALSHNKATAKLEKMSDEFIQEMFEFQKLIQMQYERSMRDMFLATLNDLIDHQKFYIDQISEMINKDITTNDVTEADVVAMSKNSILQTRMGDLVQNVITLWFSKNRGKITIVPKTEDWIDQISKFIEGSLNTLNNLQCMRGYQIGLANETEKCKIFLDTDTFMQDALQVIQENYKTLFKVPETLLECMIQYSDLLATDVKSFKKTYKSNDHGIEEYSRLLEKHMKAYNHISEVCFAEQLNLGFFVVHVGKQRDKILKKIEDLNQVLFDCIKKKITENNQNIEQEVETILGIITKEEIRDIEELTEIKTFLHNLPNKMKDIQSLINKTFQRMGLLEKYQYYLPEVEFQKTWSSFAKPLEIFGEQGDCKRRLKDNEKEFYKDLQDKNEEMFQTLAEIKLEYDRVINYSELESDGNRGGYVDAFRSCEELDEKLRIAIADAKLQNSREELFKVQQNDFQEFTTIFNKFTPHKNLWDYAQAYFDNKDKWFTQEICDLDPDLPQTISEATVHLFKMEKNEFKEAIITVHISQQLRKYYENFKQYLPLMIALKNPNLKKRHWDIIRDLKDPPLDIDQDLKTNLKNLLEADVMTIIDDISEVSDISSREKKLEDAIFKMKDEWRHIKFTLQEFKQTETYIMKGAQPIWDLLDEHIQKTMLIAASPYVKFLQSEVNYWKQTLIKVQETLEEWTRTQRGWMYLQPIFNSPDIANSLEDATHQFSLIDKMWRNIMQSTEQNPAVIDSCLQGRVYENFVQANENIDKVTKSLYNYLYEKQKQFPRFFFLSNDDLLHILSQTKEPIRVQDHLNKCFEGIDKLEFNSELKILGMHSNQAEYVPFDLTINPFDVKTESIRNIEEWLRDVETQMRDSLRSQITNSMADYSDATKKEWIFNWAQQTVLVIDQLQWTDNVEQGIQDLEENPDALKQVFEKEERKLAELVDLIKVPRTKRSEITTLEALIVMDVHSKDVTETLYKNNVQSKHDFEWMQHMRHKVVQEKKLQVLLSMINSTRYFGFEYQGNQTRLVITPLTDRCYRTLMCALQLNLGGAPEGPAGTGKTETTKDLAKALSKQCLVFNCSDQIDVATMLKFFSGLTQCGAWACFDEFNRIELEVLSVIAQLILVIQVGLNSGSKTPKISFTGDDFDKFPIDPSCAVFITMNPGYAGRSELPDNLKALFRPVAMMVPEYAMIAEISLYSYGFQQARELSVKITQSLRLSSEQLSTQSHYDYGMRTVKSIILAAGVLKRKYPDEDETKLCLRAISDCNIPKFVNDDLQLFSGIISDLFPTTDKSKLKHDELQDAVKQVLFKQNLEQNVEFEIKAIQLHETVQVRHGLMLVGQTMGGKSTIVQTLAEARTLVNYNNRKVKGIEEEQVVDDDQKVHTHDQVFVHKINPKSISIGALYGDNEKVTNDWKDGILATKVRLSAQDKTGNLNWIMLDGPVDAVWIENLNTVLDDNKKLCLISGEIIKLTDQMTMMFEVEDLMMASPATVSRCGMVFVSPDKVGWQVLSEPWIRSLPESMKTKRQEDIYRKLINHFIPEMMDFMFGKDQSLEEEIRLQGLKTVIPVTKNWSYTSFLRLFESLLFDTHTRDSLEKKEQQERDRILAQEKLEKLKSNMPETRVGQKVERTVKRSYYDESKELIEPEIVTHIVNSFIMALVWSFGATLVDAGRITFSDKLHYLVNKVKEERQDFFFMKNLNEMSLPDPEKNFFSIFFKRQENGWLKWDHDIKNYSITGDRIPDEESKDNTEQEGAMNNTSLSMGKPTIQFQDIMIATEDTIRNAYILYMLVHHSFPILVVGDTGTGKTSSIKKLMGIQQKEGTWEHGEMVLSATETPKNIQQYIDSKCEKIKKGVFGPKIPGNRMLIFIDDLNMPAKQKYLDQPPLELLRQTIDSGGYYNLKENTWKHFINMQFVAAMGLPGGGRTLPTKRLLRHFNLLHIPPFSEENLTLIFTKILGWGFEEHPEIWRQQKNKIASMTIKLYQRTVKTLLPLPGRSHYVFNLRQVSEVIQGILMVPAASITKAKDNFSLLKKLWIHECLRAFSDRLVSKEDKKLFIDKCLIDEEEANSSGIKFIDFERDAPNPDELIFSTFVKFDPQDPQYLQMESMDKLKATLEGIIRKHNQTRPKESINIILFDYFMQHLSRVARIIYKPFGHGLLIGLGGNGRKTVSQLAAYVNDCQIQRIELHKQYALAEWQEDMKNLFKSLGIDDKKIVFAMSDKEIKYEYFIEDINNILNVGELTNLFGPEDIDEIRYEISKTEKRGDPFEIFLQRCKSNLHILLYMSPAGNQLSTYFRKYPSLVNCTVIDWFLQWPKEALFSLSKRFLKDAEDVLDQISLSSNQQSIESTIQKNRANDNKASLQVVQEEEDLNENPGDITNQFNSSQNSFEVQKEDLPTSEVDSQFTNQDIEQLSLTERISQALTKMHNSACKLATQYQKEKQRNIYTTPKNFSQMFPILINLLKTQSKTIDDEKSKYEMGILKLDEANDLIDVMQEQLTQLKPVLERKSKEVDQTMKVLEQESKEAQEVQERVDAEAEIVQEQKNKAEAIRDECQARLAAAQPILDKALKALRTLSASDFVTMRSFKNPPPGVRLALEACCVMLSIKPGFIKKDGKKVQDYWEKSKAMINNHKSFLNKLEHYNKDNIPADVMNKMQNYLKNPEFEPDKIAKSSNAAEGICKWCIAMCKYDVVYKEITPKRLEMAEAQAQLEVVSAQLAEKKAQLQKIMDQNAELHAQAQQQQVEKQNLIDQKNDAQKKLQRASQLMGSIGGEKERWIKQRQKLAEDKLTLLGNIILSAASINYLGPYEGLYRQQILRDSWQKIISSYHIKMTPNFSLSEVLGDEEIIAGWQIKGIPKDNESTENMIIIEETIEKKFPIIIDPQGQAILFFQEYLEGQEMISLKANPDGLQISNKASNEPWLADNLPEAVQSTKKKTQKSNNRRTVEVTGIDAMKVALDLGSTVVCEGCADLSNQQLLSLTRKEITVMKDQSMFIKFNDILTPYNSSFRLYMFSSMANPHFAPELYTSCMIINFSVTREGLEQQLLSIVCKHESSKEEDEREKLKRQNLEFQQQKKKIMNEILNTLSESGNEILEKDDFVNQLNESKTITDDINHKLSSAKHIEERIEENRKIFKPVATHGTKLYFVMQDLPSLDPMYHFSMKWFQKLFLQPFYEKEEEKEPQTSTGVKLRVKEIKMLRVQALKSAFRTVLYRNVCMSLFERHKILFAFYMAVKINLPDEGNMSFAEKLKQLDKIDNISSSAAGNSDNLSYKVMQSKKSQQQTIGRKSRVSVSRRSSSTGAGDNQPLLQMAAQIAREKEEEKLKVNKDIYDYTLTGLLKGQQELDNIVNPDPKLFDEKTWKSVLQLSTFDLYEMLPEDITKNIDTWIEFINHDGKDKPSYELLPEPYASLTWFSLIPLYKALKPEKVINMVKIYIEKALGKYFISPIHYELSEVYQESSPSIPMLLILTPGNDPMEEMDKLSKEIKAQEKGSLIKTQIYQVSLGQGQGEKAKALISKIRDDDAGWVVLQNCHLSASFLPDLEQLIESFQPQQTHRKEKQNNEEENQRKNFRLWLTSMSVNYFPTTILQNSVKLTSEPPKSLKSSLKRSYAQICSSKAEKQFYKDNPKINRWQPLFQALCFFHAIVRERRQYGSLGWNKLYDFNDSDFRISMKQLYSLVGEHDQIPFPALEYMTGHCNYGGRVTDEQDRRVLITILRDFYNSKTVDSRKSNVISPHTTEYSIQHLDQIEDYIEYIDQLPDEESPYLFGLHENSNIVLSIKESNYVFKNILTLEGSSSGGQDDSATKEAQALTQKILQTIREPFKIMEVAKRYPFDYEESMNSVLLQELARFNRLIETIKDTIKTLDKTLQGLLVMNHDMEVMLASMMQNSVPAAWMRNSYPSRKPLMSYIEDLKKRLNMFQKWIDVGKPTVFWISGFFFTQSFLTGVKQNFARKYKHAIDKVGWQFTCLKMQESNPNSQTRTGKSAETGCYVDGLFLEGAGWNDQKVCLQEQKSKEIYLEMPIIHFIPTVDHVIDEKTRSQLYECPIYKTGERAGTLSTTGHSTNFILPVMLPSYDHEPSIWIKRSAALLCQLDD